MALVLIPILLLAMYFALAGTIRGSLAWAEALVGWLAGVFKHVPFIGGFAAAQMVNGARWIANKLAGPVFEIEVHVAGFFASLNTLTKFIVGWAFGWPVELALLAKWLVSHEIPLLVRGLKTAPGVTTRIVQRTIGLTAQEWAKVKAVARAAATGHITVPLPAWSHADITAIRWLRGHYHALTRAAAVAGGLAMPWPSLWKLRRDADAIYKRLHRVEALLGVTAFAAIMARVLGLPNARCLRGGNIGKLARGICGMPFRWLNDVLALLTDFFVLTEICEVIGWLEQGFGIVSGELTAFVGQAGMALCHGDYSAPDVLATPTLYLPDVAGFTAEAL